MQIVITSTLLLQIIIASILGILICGIIIYILDLQKELKNCKTENKELKEKIQALSLKHTSLNDDYILKLFKK